ncbi:MGMT family protein [Acinetobacter nematophilus]|uniref:MGMT family protein n=1 Tax=Acinetobacter nematophilus TaxID=2994642 RepID=A0A9X3DVP0_9GAMM|nr:MGMT family protein [Acinetobacter nematophilus]MCX5469350.1 MGMT family protein [Acinetobacter nematophilus]
MQNDELAQMILNVIVQIPKGKVASYGQVAKFAGLPKHARLVGRVLGQLPEDHDIPWYRVINSQGRISLNKLDEHGMCIQTSRLREEDVVVVDGKINLKKYQWIP